MNGTYRILLDLSANTFLFKINLETALDKPFDSTK